MTALEALHIEPTSTSAAQLWPTMAAEPDGEEPLDDAEQPGQSRVAQIAREQLRIRKCS